MATRSYELSKEPLKGRFDLAHLQAIHRHLFGDVYEWAGQRNRFAHYAHIESAAGSIFRQLAKENHLTGLGADAFSERAAWYLGELNALHPFREGNGRALRELISHLAHANGFYIAWENVSQADMLDAAIQSFNGDTRKLAAIIVGNLTRR